MNQQGPVVPRDENRALLINLDFRDVAYSFLWGRAMAEETRRRGFVVDTIAVNPFAGRDLAQELGLGRADLAPVGPGTTTYVDRPDPTRERSVVDELLAQHFYYLVVVNCGGHLFEHLISRHREALRSIAVRVYDRHLHFDLNDPAVSERLRDRLVDWSDLHVYSIEEIVSPGSLTYRGVREAIGNEATFLGTFRRLGLHPHHIHFQQWPLDEEFFSPPSVPPSGDPFVIFSGGDSGRDYASLFAAIEDLPVQLRLCASQYPTPVPKNVTILPRLPLHRFRDEVGAASLVVVPLTGHPPVSGITVVAMAKMMGKAVIASDNAIVRIQIPAQGVGGYLAQVGNPTLLRALIRLLLESPLERQRLEREAREQALPQLGLKAFIQRMSTHLP